MYQYSCKNKHLNEMISSLLHNFIPKRMDFYKIAFITLGGVLSIISNTVIFAGICSFAVCMDCYSAWSLSKRVKKAYPEANDGKFKSKHARNIFRTILEIYALIILFWLVDMFILEQPELYGTKFISGIFCAAQVWSILENSSSCNGEPWAKAMQKIMVDKASRHFDIDFKDAFKDEEDKNNGATA